MNKIKILQIIPALNTGGIERGTVDLAIYLQSQHINNAVISTGGYLESDIKKYNIKHLSLNSKSKNPFTFLMRTKKLHSAIQSIQPTILHIRSRIPAWLAYFANKKLKLPLIITCHGLHDNGFLGLKRFYNTGLTKGDHIIAVSEAVKMYLIQHFPETKNKITVIYNGINGDYFKPQTMIKNHKPIILLPGRISRWKGHDYFLKSFSRVIYQYNIDAELRIVGNAKNQRYLKQLKRLIYQLKIEDKVHFMASSEDMPSIYAQADLIISSSIEPESFGRVAVEAMAMEKLVIATRIGGSIETIIDGKTGWLVEPNNIDEMAKIVCYALTLPVTKRRLMESAARKHVLAHFTLQQMMEKTIAVYRAFSSFE